ncbi:MAG: ribosome silencing factor [Clostridiales bacterium]|nr:ribosome silencing factor [Clostridiales bacterium]
MPSSDLAKKIAELIDEKKGKEIMIVDLKGKTVIADYFVLASAKSTVAVRALADYVDEKLSKDFGLEPRGRDIDPKWAAIDYGCVILHIFHEETREFYKLERLWDDGDNITRI